MQLNKKIIFLLISIIFIFITRIQSKDLITQYAKAILYFNPKLSFSTAKKIAFYIISYSNKFKVDARFIVAIIAVESRFNPYAKSKVGAAGLGQIMPHTAKWLGVKNRYDIQENVYGTVKYIKYLLKKYRHLGVQKQVENTLAAYNAGPNAVKKYGGIPPYSETIWYVNNVIKLYNKLIGKKKKKK